MVTGMSAAPEVIVARQCGIRCFSLALVTNVCVMRDDDTSRQLDHTFTDQQRLDHTAETQGGPYHTYADQQDLNHTSSNPSQLDHTSANLQDVDHTSSIPSQLDHTSTNQQRLDHTASDGPGGTTTRPIQEEVLSVGLQQTKNIQRLFQGMIAEIAETL